MPDTTVVGLHGPPPSAGGTAGTEQPAPPYLWCLPDDGTPPEEQAARALRRLADSDPRGYPELRG
ncbi:hypothetical protein [Streptomyces wedmorensis]|uniref:hypothetical protein n=1 Tax=Streptomyces wedmorensis TaxID=43759 RepID=UPI0037A8484C